MKKSQSEIITIVLIILLVLAGIIIVWQIIQNVKSEFTITKNECRNETQCLYTNLDYNMSFTANACIHNPLILNKVVYDMGEIKIIEVCSKVEVDVSDLKNDYCTGFAELNKVMDVRNSAIQRDKCLNEKITKEWLDENCECIENIKYTTDSAENSINVPCSKYKCPKDYEVSL